MSKNKFVICIPHGGINDTLCQISKCLKYCINFDRRLIIFINRSGLLTGSFFDYFIPIEKYNDYFIDSFDYSYLETASIYPLRKKMVEMDINNILIDTSNIKDICDVKKDIIKIDTLKKYIYLLNPYLNVEDRYLYSDFFEGKITFSFEKEYKEDILIHEQFGGGCYSHYLLDYIKFSDKSNEYIIKSLDLLPDYYSAIHIRNTDYQTDYINFFKKISEKIKFNNLLICSDDKNVIDYANIFFNGMNVFTTTECAIYDNKPLHFKKKYCNDTKLMQFTTLNTLLDLVALSMSDDLHIVQTKNNNTSGFSLLSKYLNENKKILTSLFH